ncbi:MAG: TolC family protein [Bacteroidetes bacterium]|nr:TolC family protein [Bacteroidota bacterium]
MNYKIISVIVLFALALFPQISISQTTLSFEQAVEILLKNNYSISVFSDQVQISKNNTTRGNAGFLPSVSINSNGSFNNNNTYLKFSSGSDIDRKGANSNSFNTGIGLGWTVFDGMKMFASYEKLKSIQNQQFLNLKIEIENNIVNLASIYFDIVKQQKLIDATNQSIKLNDERIKITQTKLNIGSGSKLELLQAKADLNTQKSNLLKYQTTLENLKASLNQLLSYPVNNIIDVLDTIPLNPNFSYDELKKTITYNNSQVLFAKNNIDIAKNLLKESKSSMYPTIGLNANYNFINSKNQVGLVLLNQTLGFNAGFTASWKLFDGYKNRSLISNSRIALHQNQTLFTQSTSIVETALYKAWVEYSNSLKALKLEEENIEIVSENIEIAMERYRIGSSTSIELMTAQKSFEDGIARLISARYFTKMAEIELMRLNGDLIK